MKTELFVFIYIIVSINGGRLDDRSKFLSSLNARSTAVKGTLLCGKQGEKDAIIKLYKKESKDSKDVIAAQKTSSGGKFELEANTAEHDDQELEPYIEIQHTCNETEKEIHKNKFRIFGLKYPKEYVTKGRVPGKTYDIGLLNLQIIYPGEVKKEIKDEAD